MEQIWGERRWLEEFLFHISGKRLLKLSLGYLGIHSYLYQRLVFQKTRRGSLCTYQHVYADSHCRERSWLNLLRHLELFFECLGLANKCIMPQAPFPLISSPCVLERKFNPYVPDSLTLNPSKSNVVGAVRCP